MTAAEAYKRLRISDESVGDDVVIAHFVSYVYFGVFMGFDVSLWKSHLNGIFSLKLSNLLEKKGIVWVFEPI